MKTAPNYDRSKAGKYIVRLWDGFDYKWIDVSLAVDEVAAIALWNEKTDFGTKMTSYNDIDYYRIFPARRHTHAV